MIEKSRDEERMGCFFEEMNSRYGYLDFAN